ncbi:MAG: Y-family DNA polymerase [Cyclobacteriaceae bacterium]
MVALVDCNNFYVSCERVFDPGIARRPVVVLSNNDGCIISRSNEAKALGIKMGAPYFKVKPFLKQHAVKVLSSNYALYGDMSQRVVSTIRSLVPEVEVYSIDEQFLDLSSYTSTMVPSLVQKVRETILQHTGIPTSIGLAPTKTLAKLANQLAKKTEASQGIYCLQEEKVIQLCLSEVAVSALWGVGRRYAERLSVYGIYTAADLYDASEQWVRQHMTVQGMRLWYELHGTPCLPLDAVVQPKKSVTASRSFGQLQTDYAVLSAAIAIHTSRCAEKLRKQGSVGSYISVFIKTNKHQNEPQYQNSFTWTLPVATSHTGTLVQYATQALERIFRSGYRYMKCGVVVSGLTPEARRQTSLFEARNQGQQTKAMQVMDEINRKLGRNTLKVATTLTEGQRSEERWQMRQAHRSPRYTTCWQELMVVHC